MACRPACSTAHRPPAPTVTWHCRGPTNVSETSSSPSGSAGESRSYGPAPAGARQAEPAALSIGGAPGGPNLSTQTQPSAPQGGGGGGGAQQVAAKSFARLGSMVNDAVSAVRPAPNPKAKAGPSRPASAVGPQVRVRKARLRVARVDPWSVMKVSFVLSIAMGIVTMVATAVIWKVLESLGVFSSLNKTIGDLTSSGTGSTNTAFSVTSFASFGNVEGFVVIISLVDIVLITALATLGAYLYNLASGFVGGFEVTLAEDQ